MWMKKRRNLAEEITKNNNKMRVLQVVQDKINKNKKLKKKWSSKMEGQEKKKFKPTRGTENKPDKDEKPKEVKGSE